MLSAGTALASSRKPPCGVFGHVLFPQDKEGFGSITSHEENGFVFSRSHCPPLTRTNKAIYGIILYHFIQLKNCVIGKCYTSSPYTCPFIGVCRRWAQSPPVVGLPCSNVSKGLDETPQCEARGGSLAVRGKRSVYGLRFPK